MAQIISGKEISLKFKDMMKECVSKIEGRKPGLAVVIVGEDPASQVYVRNKVLACEYIGFKSEKHTIDANIAEEDLLNLIDKLNNDNTIDGILVQLPLPKHLDETKILNTIDKTKDVDGFGIESAGLLSIGTPDFISCTPLGIIKMLEYSNIDVNGMDAVVIGRSNIVGKPMAQLLTMKNATVTVCHSRTKDLTKYTKDADLIVAAVGIPKFLKADMIREDAVIIDVGIHRTENGLCGDVDFDQVKDKASFITPVPGGVGPMTITMLMYNTIKAYELHEQCEVSIGF